MFEAADRAARRRRISRSELYAAAIERYLASEPDDEITARLNSIYGAADSAVDPALAEAQRRILRRTEW